MKMISTALVAAFFSAAFWTCAAPKPATGASDLDILVSQMSGHFTSTEQSKRDTDFFDITLRMAPIWPERTGEKWLYVEQAVTKNIQKPYRQRVYKVEKLADGRFQSAVFTLEKPEEVIGWWAEPSKFSAIAPQNLSLREGCAVLLKKEKAGVFVGATEGSGCESTLRGAKYASSKVSVFADRLVSWDQGFDAAGKQVWGAGKGGYEFIRVK